MNVLSESYFQKLLLLNNASVENNNYELFTNHYLNFLNKKHLHDFDNFYKSVISLERQIYFSKCTKCSEDIELYINCYSKEVNAFGKANLSDCSI